MVVLTIVFGRLAEMPSGGVPYPILVFCGMLPWQLFSTAVSESSNSLIGNSSLISKVYFPRMTIPASSVITSCVDFAISVALLALLMGWYSTSRQRESYSAWLCAVGVGGGIRNGFVDLGADGQLSGLSVRCAVHRSIWPLHLPGWIQQRRHSGTVATGLLAESHGRSDRRIPLGIATRRLVESIQFPYIADCGVCSSSEVVCAISARRSARLLMSSDRQQ